MRFFAVAVFAYMIIGAGIVFGFRDNPLSLVMEMIRSIPAGYGNFLLIGWWILPVFLVFGLAVDRAQFLNRIAKAVVAVLLCTGFFLFFTVVKTTMPFIVPFWADPMMAEVDHVLHFGVDPWRITHAFSTWISSEAVRAIYYRSWLLPAMYLPVLIIMFDSDATRFKRFVTLYLLTWVGLGNVVALAFLSAGPVFHDRLFDSSHFADLTTALANANITTGDIGKLMDRLWAAYQSGAQKAGSGISAFPSVHVGMTTVFGLYLIERHRLLTLPAIAIIATFQFLSVYQGWHYAVDGYFSILVVTCAWLWLRRRAQQDPNLTAELCAVPPVAERPLD